MGSLQNLIQTLEINSGISKYPPFKVRRLMQSQTLNRHYIVPLVRWDLDHLRGASMCLGIPNSWWHGFYGKGKSQSIWSINQNESRIFLEVFLLQLCHKDLAARNVLVNDQFLLKISDFGLTRQAEGVYFSRNMVRFTKKNEASTILCNQLLVQKPTPKETAPEALTHLIFTEYSDVFSFGILLFGLFDLSPYISEQIIQIAREKPYQLPKPFHANSDTWIKIYAWF